MTVSRRRAAEVTRHQTITDANVARVEGHAKGGPSQEARVQKVGQRGQEQGQVDREAEAEIRVVKGGASTERGAHRRRSVGTASIVSHRNRKPSRRCTPIARRRKNTCARTEATGVAACARDQTRAARTHPTQAAGVVSVGLVLIEEVLAFIITTDSISSRIRPNNNTTDPTSNIASRRP